LLIVTPFQSYNNRFCTQSRKEINKEVGGRGGGFFFSFFKDAKLLRKRQEDLLCSSLIKNIMRREKIAQDNKSVFPVCGHNIENAHLLHQELPQLFWKLYNYDGKCCFYFRIKLLPAGTDKPRALSTPKP